MSWITGNRYLNMEEMQENAQLFRDRMQDYGFTIESICGMLGNIQTESTINPGIWQSLKEWSGGYGLTQWTPYTKYSEWAGSGWQDNGDKECERINYEFENGIQYYKTKKYPITAEEFKNSTESPSYLAWAFIYNYERPKNKNQPKRAEQADYWYEFLTGEQPPTPVNPPHYCPP